MGVLTFVLLVGITGAAAGMEEDFEDGTDGSWNNAYINSVSGDTPDGDRFGEVDNDQKSYLSLDDRHFEGFSFWVRTNDYSNQQLEYSVRSGNSDRIMRIDTGDGNFANIDICSDNENTGLFDSPVDGNWYKIEFEPDWSSNEFDVRLFDRSGNLEADYINHPFCGGDGESSADTFYARDVASGATLDVDAIFTGSFNNAPTFQSTSVNPDPPIIRENTSYSFEASDSDGTIDSGTLTVYKDGSQVYSDSVSFSSSSVSYTWSDVYSPDSEGDLDAKFQVTDDAGATTTEWLNRTLTNEAPQVSVQKPSNSSYFSYSVPLEFSASDSDSVPGEDYSCSVDLDSNQVESYTLIEGSNATVDDTVSADLGSHTVNVSCSDPDGNTGSQNQSFTVKAFEVSNVDAASPVYETSNQDFDLDVRHGDMVNSFNYSLFYSSDEVNFSEDSVSGNQYFNTSLSHEVPLVGSNGASKSWYYSVEANISDWNNPGSYTDIKNSSSQSQTVDWVVQNPSLNIGDDKYIEKEDAQLEYSYTDNGFNGDIKCTLAFNGSSKTGDCTDSFDTGLSSTASTQVSGYGEAELTFEGSSRTTSNKSDTTDVHKKILTDCSNSVNGVTGSQALLFELFNEENRTQRLNGNIVFNFDTTHHGEHTRNYAFDKSGVKNQSVCMYPDWTEYSITGPVQYSSQSSQNSLNKEFPDRQYNLFNQTLNNNSENLEFFLLEDSLATPVYFEVLDKGGNPVPGATVSVRRYFIGEDSYLTVAKSQADSDGVATTYMRVNEIYYKYTVTDSNGDVLLDTNRSILTCQSSPCTKTLRVNPEGDNPYFENREGFSFSTQRLKDDSGNITGFQATVSHDQDVMQRSTLQVSRGGALGDNLICNISATSNPTTHVCSFNEPVGKDTISYSLTATADDYTYTLDTGYINKAENLFKANAYFAAAVIFMMFAMMGAVSPKVGMVFSAAGIIVPWAIGFYSISLAAVGALVAITLFAVVTNTS